MSELSNILSFPADPLLAKKKKIIREIAIKVFNLNEQVPEDLEFMEDVISISMKYFTKASGQPKGETS